MIAHHQFEAAFAYDDAREVLLALHRSISARQAAEQLDFHALLPAEKLVSYLLWFDKEVANGCLMLFFQGDHAAYALEMLDALEMVGAERNWRLFEQALSVFPLGRPARSRARRTDQLYAAGDRAHLLLSALDRSFAYEAEDALTLGVIYLEAALIGVA